MKLKFLIVAISISCIGFSQDYYSAMQVFKSDLKNTSYAKDSTANALVVYDYGNSFINKKTFLLTVQLKQKIKILRPEGVERGEFEIKLYKSKKSEETIRNIEGITYNLKNDEIVKTTLTKEAIFKEENEKFTLVKFVLPNVKVGSVITVSYETRSPFISKFQPWYFQGTDPILYSEYNTSIPGNYIYHTKLVGTLPLDKHVMGIDRKCISLGGDIFADCATSKYIMKNIPAYKTEAFTTTPLNYTARIEYELSVVKGFDGSVDKRTKTWKAVDKELKTNSDFGKQISKKSIVKDVLPESISSIKDNLTKANAIYQFVLENYKWNGKSQRYDVSIKNLLKEKVGSAFEINLLLENLLSNEGIKTFPILLSTRENGFATKIHPVLTDFNYVILKSTINDKDFLLDATDPYLSFGELPFKCLNQYGRLIDFENGSYWEPITINNYSSQTHRIELTAFKDDVFLGNLKSDFSNYHSHQPKKQFSENEVVYLERKSNNYKDISISEHSIIDFDKTKSNFSEHIQFSIEPEFIGNKIYLNPFIIKFFEENPFKLQERTYPIDFGYKDIYTFIIKIELNDSIKIVDTPLPIQYALPQNLGSVVYNVNTNDKEVLVYFKVKFNGNIYPPEYYEHLKTFMDKVVEAQNNSVIVFEKI
ncbi:MULTISPECIES: hypothetical protein [unclassified Winogradskyella]|uniref:hypothetical protein n=1 Tax=unclassified Winogradskyella TaxID=2615021 RepID=UPI002FF25782